MSHPQAGGSEVNLFEQAKRWRKSGHEVTVLCSDPGANASETQVEYQDGIQVRRMGGRFTVYPFAAWALLKHGREYDVVLDVANGIPFFAPLFTRTPATLLVHHVHGQQWYIEMPRPLALLGLFLEQKIMPLIYRGRPVIAVSPTTSDSLVKAGVDRQQISVVYNGTNAPTPEELSDGQVRRGPRLAYVGRLKRYKRIEKLLLAVSRLRGEFPDVRLDIAGDGDARAQLEELTETLGVRDLVTLHGYVDEAKKHEILNRASVFAMPSLHEGWGLSVIEANAHGVPAVAFDVPGLNAAIRDGVTGVLAHDDVEFEAALGRLLGDEEMRVKYAERAREWAKRFNWDAAARGSLEVLKACARHEEPGTVRSRRSQSAA